MKSSIRSYLGWGIGLALVTVAVTGSGPSQLRKQTLAPQELNAGDGPPPIIRKPPALPKGNINYESAEEPRLRVVVLAKGLQQPWSMAFLPDGAILVTERIGRLRIVRNGNLVSSPVAGVPAVKPGGPRGLQGLMDVVLHPHFSENKWVYLAYHKPVQDGAGETVLARGTWDGKELVDVHEIFDSAQ